MARQKEATPAFPALEAKRRHATRHVGCGRWAFVEATDPYDDVAALIRSTPPRADTSRAVGASP